MNPKVEVSVNRNAAPDKRSYKVDFGLFKKLAPDHQPVYDLQMSIDGLFNGLEQMNFNRVDFRNSLYMRLNVITDLLAKGVLNEQLYLK